MRALEPGERTGTTITFWASPDIFETTTYNFETITTRFREMAFLNKGLEIVVRDERPAAEEIADAVEDETDRRRGRPAGADAIKRGETGGIEQVFKYDRGLVDYVEYLNRRKQARAPHGHLVRGRDPESVESHMSLEVAMQWNTTLHRVGAHLREHHQHPRGRHPRGGLPGRADLAGQQLGAASGA